MVHLGIFTSLLHIGGWEKDCGTAIFNEDLPSQLTTTLYGVDSRLPLPHRTQTIHGNSTRGIAAQTSSIRPLERELPIPLETARRRRRRRRRLRTKFLHGTALKLDRSQRKRTQTFRPDAQSIATISTAPWAKRRMRARELRLAAPSIRFVLLAAAVQQRHEHLELSQCGSPPQVRKSLLATARHMRRYPALQPLAGLDRAPRVPRTPARRPHPARSTPLVLLMREGFPPRPAYQTHVEMFCFLQCFVRRRHGILFPKMDKSSNIAADAPLRVP